MRSESLDIIIPMVDCQIGTLRRRYAKLVDNDVPSLEWSKGRLIVEILKREFEAVDICCEEIETQDEVLG